MQGDVAGVVMEINWRATRIRTTSNEMVFIPNSVVAKAILTNHRRLDSAHVYGVRVKIDHQIPPARVIEALLGAAHASAGIAAGTTPTVYACQFVDGLIEYEISVGIDDYGMAAEVTSEVIRQAADALGAKKILIGAPPTGVRILARSAGEMH